MTWLAEVRVSMRESARLRLSDSYAWHRRVWKTFPGVFTRDWLMRIDELRGSFRLYIISGIKPEVPAWGSWRIREVGKSFLAQDRYLFQLRANPTVKKWRDGRKHGTRVAIYDRESLVNWLIQKGEAGGFRVDPDNLEISPPINQPFNKKGTRGNHKRVDYRGILTVTDHEKFAEAFRMGVGPAKAFGFGMLILKPIKGGKQ